MKKEGQREGDLVMPKVFNRTKLDSPFRGSFAVIEKSSPNYVLGVNGKRKIYHASHLKLFPRRGELDLLDTRLPEPEENTAESSSGVWK